MIEALKIALLIDEVDSVVAPKPIMNNPNPIAAIRKPGRVCAGADASFVVCFGLATVAGGEYGLSSRSFTVSQTKNESMEGGDNLM